jgi:hypothetical protein
LIGTDAGAEVTAVDEALTDAIAIVDASADACGAFAREQAVRRKRRADRKNTATSFRTRN